jgi:DNA-directed RNA polymerase subunit M/transcription elongation factor TFIIS
MPIRKIENPDLFRNNIRQKLCDFFDKIENKEKHASNLEKGIHNWALKEATNKKVVKKWDNPFFVQIYLDHLRSIYINLKNEKIIQMVNSGEIKTHEIAFMTHQEMKPKKWEELIRLKSIRDKNKFEQNMEANTDLFTCRKCYSKRCTYMQMQCRSADEPMTVFISCLDCGARMKK